jgi:DNA-binding NtrC family response regulator
MLLLQSTEHASQQDTGTGRNHCGRHVRHDFPGNVRELQNILEHAFVLCRGGKIEPSPPPDLTLISLRGPTKPRPDMNLRAAERSLIEAALAKHAGRRSVAAAELGIDLSTLYRKIHRLGIVKPGRDGRGQRAR